MSALAADVPVKSLERGGTGADIEDSAVPYGILVQAAVLQGLACATTCVFDHDPSAITSAEVATASVALPPGTGRPISGGRNRIRNLFRCIASCSMSSGYAWSGVSVSTRTMGSRART